MIRNQSIICFAGEDWWYHHQHSKNHIMRRLARAGNRVIFVNSISMGLPSLASRDFFSKIKRKLRSYAKPVRVTEEGIIVVSPPVLPFYSSRWARVINRWLLVAQIKLLMVAFDMPRPILWIAIPTAREVVGRLGERALIYQVSDKYDANQMDHATASSVIAEMHDDLLARADLVYYSGRKLFEEETAKYSGIAGKARLLEQAVDYEHFASATSQEWTQPDEVASVPHPRLGYFGAIDPWLVDQELIRYVSRKRPEWHWVFVGLRASPLDIESLTNVHYLGSKPYSSMPQFAAAFDVCVLPWVTDNEFVNYGSPIKVREYLATGKPVVITPIYEYERLDGILRVSRGYDDFIAKVGDALNADSPDKREARQQAVKEATWDARAEEVSEAIAALVERK
ncbi:MAG TPA: glycosyltransferase [Blastocatellia bacterium]|nr:glycosyltransferase [Blastocatellia bacterium]